MNVTHLILKNLIHDEEYARTTLPYLESKYFDEHIEKIVYEQVNEFISKYNSLPTREALVIELDNRKGMSDKEFTECGAYIGTLIDDEKEDPEWLVNTTEKFCQEKALYNAIMDSIAIIDGESDEDKGAIPELLTDALSVSFDPNVGHDFLDDADDRYDFYHRVEERIPFDIDYLNKITKGGLPKKSLTVLMAGTGVGKSLAMCHFASANMLDGKNVLYITMEMAEERIAERIDANLMNVSLNDIESIGQKSFINKVKKISQKTTGKLIVKEYPTASAHVGHFRALLNELKLKKNFVPDIIFIDYLNICASSRIKGLGGSVNTYSYIKSIAEELRGLAVEFDVPILSATQTTRSGFSNSDVGLEDTSESFGLPATADMMFALISTEELANLNQLMVKQLKNRYADIGTNKRFVIGVDRPKMRLYDVEASAQTLIQVDQGTSNNHIPTQKTLDTEGFKF